MIVNDFIYLSTVPQTADIAAYQLHCNNANVSQGVMTMPFPYTEMDAIRVLGLIADNNRKHPLPTQFIIRKRDTDEAIGAIGMLVRYGWESHKDEIGYWLSESYWGRGWVTDAVKTLVNYAFEQRGLIRVEARVFSFNKASAKVLEKAGFDLEGVFRKNEAKHGVYHDGLMYAILKP